MGRTCCFTGHREYLYPFKAGSPKFGIIKSKLKEYIGSAIQCGFDCFIVGGANGADEWALDILSEMKSNGADISIEIAVPFAAFPHKKGSVDKETIVSVETDPLCYEKRNHYMVDHSERLIAVYDESYPIEGGTKQTVGFAVEAGLEIEFIRWHSLTDHHPET
ncbi:MAG: DUF1273 family protein [Eubacteriaceae bacterium]|nr:DUF1273 family protein [Eubacteriaceae bacterium]